MVDIVVNHNAWAGDSDSVDYSTFNPFNDCSYYNTYCAIDYYSTASVQNCWLGDSSVELPDLKTEESVVAISYQAWITELVHNYSSTFLLSFVPSACLCHLSFQYQGFTARIVRLIAILVDGLRVDTAKHVDTSFWAGFESAAGVFMMGEFSDKDPSLVCPGQEYMDGVLNYPL